MPTQIDIVYEGFKRFKDVTIRTEVCFQINFEIPHEKAWYFPINSFQDIFQLPDVFLPEFEDTVQGIWIICDYLSPSQYPNLYKQPVQLG